MLLRDFVLVARVGQVHSGLIEFLARHRALLKKFLPAVVDFLLRGKEFFGGLRVELGLLNFLGQVGNRGGLVGGLGLIVGAFVLLGRGREVAVLKHRQQLAFVYPAAAFDVESFDRRADLGSDGRLLQREENGFGRDCALNGFLLDGDHLYRNCGFFLAGILGAAQQEE